MFTIMALHVMLAVQAPVTPVCVPEPLPIADLRTDEFWKSYLTRNLHRCYDRLAPEIASAGVAVNSGPFASVLCPMDICTVVVGRDLLDSVEVPEETLYIIGHEAAHIAMQGRDFRGLSTVEMEFAADILAVRNLRNGGCFAAKVLGWIDGNMDESLFKEPRSFTETVERLRQRRTVMIAFCTVDAVAGGDR